jgi:pyrroloquinoline quinone (PQQ) biosynthesis protein C
MRNAEGAWLERLLAGDAARAHSALVRFVPQYHWFSQHQVVAFSRLLAQVPAHEVETLVELADVLSDELGRGSATAAHSLVFARFARSVGYEDELPIAAAEVIPEVAAYVELLHRCFTNDLVGGAAAYRFLEASAVASYAPLLEGFRRVVVDADLDFFVVHAELEPHHLDRAKEAAGRLIAAADQARADHIDAELAQAWSEFWTGLTRHCFES